MQQVPADWIRFFEEIIALIALYRPGPMQFIPQFIQGKKDPSTVKIPHPRLLKDLVEETYGVLVYQEQVRKRLKSLQAILSVEQIFYGARWARRSRR